MVLEETISMILRHHFSNWGLSAMKWIHRLCRKVYPNSSNSHQLTQPMYHTRTELTTGLTDLANETVLFGIKIVNPLLARVVLRKQVDNDLLISRFTPGQLNVQVQCIVSNVVEFTGIKCCCCRCPDGGPRGRMAGPEEEYARRERLLLLHHSGDRYLDRYLPPPAPAPNDRYNPPPPAPAPNERYVPPPSPDRYNRYDRYQYYGERYVSPQTPSDRYLCGSYHPAERYVQSPPGGPGDPYMRRDLGYHHHYRLPPPPGFYHTVYQRNVPAAPPRPHRSHIRCCPSIYPQASVSPVLTQRGRTCRPTGGGGTVEYVGASGGRYVSTTPPLPRCASVSDVKVDTQPVLRGCDTMSLCCTTRRPLPHTQLLTPHYNSVWWVTTDCISNANFYIDVGLPIHRVVCC